MKDAAARFGASNEPPWDYMRPPDHDGIVTEKDVFVSARDGVRLCVDIYRPDAPGRFPALLAFGTHTKEIQGPEYPKEFPAQPSWSTLWVGHMEAGDTRFFVTRGYVHVVGGPRAIGRSEGGGSREFDSYDLIEWIAAQPWCDGNVGMVGIGAFASEQFHAAKQQPPHLKAIFPYDPRGAYGSFGGFREEYPGGVFHAFRYLQDHFTAVHTSRAQPGELPPQTEVLWRKAMADPDYRMYPHLFNVLAQKGEHMPRYFAAMIDPYDREENVREAEAALKQIEVPVHTGAGWYGYTYKTHLAGAQNYFREIGAPKKLTLAGPSHPDRPLRALRSEMLRWYDHWLKGIENGAIDGPPVRYWVTGANQWRSATDWPIPETEWTKLYLNSWARLTPNRYLPASNDEFQPPDSFVQMPQTQTNRVEKLRYLTDPLPQDLLVAGPIMLTLFASIDQTDTNWIVILKDVGPDGSVRSAREGERDIPSDLPERELTRGWLKASHRALDPDRSLPWKPWHYLTREAQKPVVPDEVTEYQIEVMSTANLFRARHRICLEITCLDFPTGVSGATNVEYIPYHVCSSRTVLHRIFHDPAHPSHLLLPIVPFDERGES